MFLEQVIKDICASGNPKWDEYIFILPSNRSIRDFKILLSQKTKVPLFSPRFYTIEDFIAKVSGLSLCNPVNLQLEFYKVYLENNPHGKEDYTSFLNWSNSALGDFNEIDRYLIPPKEIFGYLSAISSIKNWSPTNDATSLISKYSKFINELNVLYSKLNDSLLTKGLGYQGMLYRHAVKNIDSHIQSQTGKSFKIISLNALNKAEKTILSKLLTIPTTKIYWDIDNIFLKDKLHSAGYFIRQNLSYFDKYSSKQKLFSTNGLLKDKSIQITGVPKNISQAKLLGKLLQGIDFEKKSVALVLADETLLPAILNSLPKIKSGVNITMGYPIALTQAYRFMSSILLLAHTEPQKGYYYKDVQSFLKNPIVSCLLNPEDIRTFEDETHKNNEIYIRRNKLLKLLSSDRFLPKIILEQAPLVQELESLISFFRKLNSNKNLLGKKIELESISLIISSLNELLIDLSTLSLKLNSKDVNALIESKLSEKSISFKGDPNKGLQIMGLLETRALDFDTILITSVNEGILPAGKSYNSFIPFDVKREFGLPTVKEKDAVYTYHFYRLLQRAKKVHLIYNTEPDVLKGGEPSRFIHQLSTHEQLKPFVHHKLSSPKIGANKSIPIKVEKNKLLIEHLKMIASEGFSPSSLAQYIRNPLLFYKQYVLAIETPQSVDEDISYNVLGSIIHDSLERVYSPLVGQKLTPEILTEIESDIEAIIFSEFEKYYNKNSILLGKNLILFQVVKKYIQGVILRDKSISKNQELKILFLEKKSSITLVLKHGKEAVLKGKLDRVDMLNDQLRILDYKTGTVERSALSITNFDELFSNKKYDKAFQLLCYALLFDQNENQMPNQALIVPIKQISQDSISLRVDKSPMISTELLQRFQSGLTALIEEILNPEIPFTEKVD